MYFYMDVECNSVAELNFRSLLHALFKPTPLNVSVVDGAQQDLLIQHLQYYNHLVDEQILKGAKTILNGFVSLTNTIGYIWDGMQKALRKYQYLMS